MVAVHQTREQDLDLLQSEIVADTAAGAGGEGQVRGFVAVADLGRGPALGLEALRVAPVGRVLMDGGEGGDEDSVGGEAVATGQDEVLPGVAGGLEGGGVQAHGFLEEVVQDRHGVHQVVRVFRVRMHAEIDQFL